jgi:hypothetical protein
MTALDRMLLTLTSILAAYQVSVGIDGLDALPVFAYTIAFGVLLVAALLLVILGFDVLDSPLVVIISTIIPLSLSFGLVWERSASFRTPYLIFTLTGFLAVVTTRSLPISGRLPIIVLALVHGVAGLTIFLLPILITFAGEANPGFAMVGLGGALIGLGGLFLSFLKTGKPILPRETALKLFPGLLFLMTATYVVGFVLR